MSEHSNPNDRTRAMRVALSCEHGRWVGEAQFAACVDCIAAALADAPKGLSPEPRPQYAFGAMPPPGAKWMIGKTAEEIAAVRNNEPRQPLSDEALAEIMFEAFQDALGNSYSQWSRINEERKTAWMIAAQAVRAALAGAGR